jgi:NAD(P)-dependent dehydrogenase (short-subunit alcohol dehydrogenase family)
LGSSWSIGYYSSRP